MRMVWLALFCLMALAITVVAKIGMSPYANVDVSKGMPSAKAAISRETSAPDTVAFSSKNVTAGTTKADKLEVSYTNEAPPEVKSVKSVAIILPATAPKEASNKMERIVSRHWHDPFDKRNVPAAPQPLVKRKMSNTNANRPPMITARAPKS
jgi:hypothetical protein